MPARQTPGGITVTKDDLLLIDANQNNKPDPGDTLAYEIEISNAGLTDLEDVIFSDSLPQSLTLVPGSLETTPIAFPQTLAILEDTLLDVTLTGYDADGDAITITLESDPQFGALSGAMPVFTYTPDPNFEGTDSFTFKVCDDSTPTPFCDTSTITIHVGGDNDAPVVSPATFSIDENTPNDTVIGTVSFSDVDAGQMHTFAITAGNTGGAFQIDVISGEITVADSSALDFESNPVFTLTVTVGDDGLPPLTGDGTITINLNDVNEAPLIAAQSFSIAEGSIAGTSVGTVAASDPDSGQSISYAITTGNTGSAFAINAASGEITVADASEIDFDVNPSFSLTVQVTDDASTPLSASAAVTISLEQVSSAPVVSAAVFGADENSANGTVVGTVTVTDENTSQTHSFEITAGNTGGAFAINSSTGVISVANQTVLDYETNPSFSLTVTATDNDTPPLSGSGTITINLVDLNEAPLISAQSFSIAEGSAVGTSVGTVAASDPDTGQSISYAITAGNTGGAFAINAASGEITVADMSAIDFDVTPSFSLTVQVTDDASTPLSASATVTISLEQVSSAPVVSAAVFQVDENSANGTTVGTVTVTDENASQTHTFGITGGNTNGAFAINSSTGVISVANMAALDFETNSSFSLTVTATDNDTPPLSGSATITINLNDINEAPVINNQSFSLDEGSPNGSSVGTVAASDPDTGQSISYAITAGNTGGAFTINAASGEITVADTSAIDFDVTPSFSLTVQVTDDASTPLSASATVTVSLEQVSSAPVVSAAVFQVDENSANGTTVGTVTVTDENASQTHTFGITGGNTNGAFAINSSTGVISVANMAALDFETNSSFLLTVTATDNDTPPLSGSATITINLNDINEAPVIANQTFGVNEDALSGAAVGTVAASDQDTGQSLTFSIVSGNTDSAFVINSSSGAITVSNPSFLDYETEDQYVFSVQVSDNGTPALSATATVTINVLDVNEAPVFTGASFTLAENSAAGTAVGTLTASDPDAGQALTYAIMAGNTAGAFALDADSGEITVLNASALDYESNPSFSLTVEVSDDGTPLIATPATVTINLTDVNEAPTINASSFSIAENSANGTTVGIVTASDPDSGQTLSYAITAGNGSGVFAINAASGAITVTNSASLNYESGVTSYSLTVQVSDNGTPALADSATVNISVLDVNEAPIFSAQSFSVDENSPNATVVGSVSASDPDSGQTLAFSIQSGNTGGAFAINSATGVISVANVLVLDYETTPVFTLLVRVSDNGSPVLFAEASVTISVNDVNDPPAVTGESYETIGNTELQVASGSSGSGPHVFVNGNLLSNDSDVENDLPLQAALDTATTGAVVTVNSDGSFTYTPPPGQTGTDSFSYTVTDSKGASATGTVNIQISKMVWYVKNDAAAGGVGTSSFPFRTLAEAGAASSAGDIIFVYYGDGTTTGQNAGFSFKNEQQLIGQGVGLSVPVAVNGGSAPTVLLAASGANPKIGNANGVGVTLANGNTILGFEISSTNGAAVLGASVGSFSLQSSSVASGGGAALDLSGGAADVALTSASSTGNAENRLKFANLTGTVVIDSGTLANSSQTLVNISGGTLSLEYKGSLSQANNAALVSISNHSSGTIDFSAATLSASNGSGLQFSNADGVYNFSGLTTLNGGDAGIDILAGSAGTFTFGDSVSVLNPSGNAFTVLNSTPTVTYSGSIQDSSGYLLDVDNMDGGSLLFKGGAFSSTGSGMRVLNSNNAQFDFQSPAKNFSTGANAAITLTNNAGSTVRFSGGGLVISTTSGNGLDASTSGTLEVSGENNTITSTTGVALKLNATTIAAAGLTFRSIFANGSVNGISLSNTGTLGGLTVSGTGTAGSGGTIQNTTGSAIQITGSRSLSLQAMNVSASKQHGIHLNTVSGFTLVDSDLAANGDAIAEYGVYIQQPSGVYNITNSRINDSYDHNIQVTGTSGVVSSFSVLNNTSISHASVITTADRNGINFHLPSGNLRFDLIEIQGNTFSGNDTAVRVNATANSVVSRVNVSGNTMNGTSNGVSMAADGNSTLNYLISNNIFNSGKLSQISVSTYKTAVSNGLVSGNNVSITSGNAFSFGMAFSQIGNSTHTINVATNTVSGFGDSGIYLSTQAGAGGGSGSLNATLTGNGVSTTVNSALAALYLQSGSTGGNETNKLCLNANGNTLDGGPGTLGFGYPVDVALDYVSPETILNLQGNTDPANPATYFASNNTLIHGSAAVKESNSNAVYPNATCPTSSVVASVEPSASFVSVQENMNEAEYLAGGKVRLSPVKSAESISLDLGVIPAGKTIRISFQAQIANPLPTDQTRISNQAILSGANFATVRSDDPETPEFGDATITTISLPDRIPDTGFAPSRKTELPLQTEKNAYRELGSVWMEIPSQNLKATIVGVPLTDQGWQVDWLNRDVGYLQGTAFPSRPGNSVLTAHVYDSNGNPGPFVNLGKLIWGRQIIVHAFGSRYVYEVRSVQWFTDPENTAAFGHEEKSWLTLVTCRGYDEKSDSYRWRTIVRAVLVKVEAE